MLEVGLDWQHTVLVWPMTDPIEGALSLLALTGDGTPAKYSFLERCIIGMLSHRQLQDGHRFRIKQCRNAKLSIAGVITIRFKCCKIQKICVDSYPS